MDGRRTEGNSPRTNGAPNATAATTEMPVREISGISTNLRACRKPSRAPYLDEHLDCLPLLGAQPDHLPYPSRPFTGCVSNLCNQPGYRASARAMSSTPRSKYVRLAFTVPHCHLVPEHEAQQDPVPRHLQLPVAAGDAGQD